MSRRKFVLAGTGVAAISIGGIVVSSSSSESTSNCQDGAVLQPPFTGDWMVMNPPGHPDLADDFIGMRNGHRLPYSVSSLPRHLISRMPVSQAYGWNRPVYSPVEGTVLEVSNNEPDTEQVNLAADAVETLRSPPEIENGDIRPAAGNYVVIDSEEGVSFLAHMRKGSVVVEEGMTVTTGQLLGNVGNSGASLFPHLHYQLMSEWTADISRMYEVLLPYRFSTYERRTGGWLAGYSWKSEENCVPQQGERFRI